MDARGDFHSILHYIYHSEATAQSTLTAFLLPFSQRLKYNHLQTPNPIAKSWGEYCQQQSQALVKSSVRANGDKLEGLGTMSVPLISSFLDLSFLPFHNSLKKNNPEVFVGLKQSGKFVYVKNLYKISAIPTFIKSVFAVTMFTKGVNGIASNCKRIGASDNVSEVVSMGGAGTLTGALMTPVECVEKRFQKNLKMMDKVLQSQPFTEQLQSIFKEEGLRGFMKGAKANVRVNLGAACIIGAIRHRHTLFHASEKKIDEEVVEMTFGMGA